MATSNYTIHCPRCGRETQPGASFCALCGAALPGPEPRRSSRAGLVAAVVVLAAAVSIAGGFFLGRRSGGASDPAGGERSAPAAASQDGGAARLPEATPTPAPTPEPTAEPLMLPGFYALARADGRPFRYVRAEADRLTWYDQYGAASEPEAYTYDGYDGTYTAASSGAFTVVSTANGLLLRGSEGSFLLTPIGEAEIPAVAVPLNGTVEGSLISGAGWVLYGDIPEKLADSLERTPVSTTSEYVRDSHRFTLEVRLYAGEDLDALIEEARASGFGGYSTEEEMIFRLLSSRLYASVAGDFSARNIAIQENLSITKKYNGTRWWITGICGGYRTKSGSIIDVDLILRMEDGAAFAVYVRGDMNGADTSHYTAAYNSFLSKVGWLYTIPSSMRLERQ